MVKAAFVICSAVLAIGVVQASAKGVGDSEIAADKSPTNPTRLGNISTRARVESGDNVLIAGFIVTGTQPKKVIVRGIGPSLPFAGHLENPMLELRDSSGALLESNDDWTSSTKKQAIMDSAISPSSNLESAVVTSLVPGSYTAVLSGVNHTTGTAVVEVYDLDSSADSKLVNISTRGMVSTADDVMIAGTIVSGTAPQKVIIRAIGPSLSLSGKLGDPMLELRDANGGLIEANDNWGDSPSKQAIIDSTLAPSHPLESAIVATLQPRSTYTAIVRGVEAAKPTVTRLHYGSGNTLEIQEVQLARTPTSGYFTLTVLRPRPVVSGQPGDRAALEDTIGIPWNAQATDIKTAIMASHKFFKYDQNSHLTAGPDDFHTLFDSGGGLGIDGNEGSRREPRVSGSVTDFTITFGTLTTGNVGTRNTWIIGMPLVEVNDDFLNYGDTGVAVVEVYALP